MPRKLALITGASAGIGEVFARRLAVDYDLLLVARRRETLEALASELSAAHGCDVRVLAADLATDEGVASVAARISSEPRLTMLVNNAGFGKTGLFWESPVALEERMHRLHILATLRLSHAALSAMVPRDEGVIINVASVAAFVRGAGSAGYAATKTWMTAFTEGLYLELKSMDSKVSVQALCPGFTYSEFHDLIKVDRTSLVPKSLWLTAEEVVDASLEGLGRGKLFVIPNFRYRLITAFFTKVPVWMRLALESKRKKARLRTKPE